MRNDLIRPCDHSNGKHTYRDGENDQQGAGFIIYKIMNYFSPTRFHSIFALRLSATINPSAMTRLRVVREVREGSWVTITTVLSLCDNSSNRSMMIPADFESRFP